MVQIFSSPAINFWAFLEDFVTWWRNLPSAGACALRYLDCIVRLARRRLQVLSGIRLGTITHQGENLPGGYGTKDGSTTRLIERSASELGFNPHAVAGS